MTTSLEDDLEMLGQDREVQLGLSRVLACPRMAREACGGPRLTRPHIVMAPSGQRAIGTRDGQFLAFVAERI